MRDIEDIFSQDVEVPEVVLQKADAAFTKIKAKETRQMVDSDKFEKKIKTRRVFRTQAAVIAGICVLGAGSITAVAAINHFWSKGVNGTIQATDQQQQALTEKGMAEVLSESPDYQDIAMTCENVTITPETVIVDEKFAVISFSVKGYDIGDDVEPLFETVEAKLVDDSDQGYSDLNMDGSFYDGLVSDENGDLEYIVRISTSGQDDSLLGKNVRIGFTNLGTANHADYVGSIEAKWAFVLQLPDVSTSKNIELNKEVENTVFILNSIEVSPISMKLNYTVTDDVKMNEDENGVPEFCGVVLKDGTRIPYLANGGQSGYTDENMKGAYEISAFNRVINADDITSLLIRANGEIVEISLN